MTTADRNNVGRISVFSLVPAHIVPIMFFRSSGEDALQLKEEVAEHLWLSSRKSQEYLVSVGGQEDCCPSQMEMIEPSGGSNPDGLYVELYR